MKRYNRPCHPHRREGQQEGRDVPAPVRRGGLELLSFVLRWKAEARGADVIEFLPAARPQRPRMHARATIPGRCARLCDFRHVE
jgi:hypothetical protein